MCPILGVNVYLSYLLMGPVYFCINIINYSNEKICMPYFAVRIFSKSLYGG